MTPEQIQKIKYIILNHWKGEKEIYNSKERDRQTKKTDLETTISRLKHKIQASVIPNMSIDESKHIDVTNKEALLVFLKVIQEGGTEGTALEKLEAHLSKKQFSYANQATQAAAQSNETQTTGESTQVEKINWKGSQTQLAYLVQILLENGFIEHCDHWKMCAEHFLWQGKQIDNKKLAAAIGNVASFNKDGKPKKAEILESIVSDLSNLEE